MRYADRAERERQYSPSSMVDDLPGLLERYSRQSDEVRSQLPWETTAYGNDLDEKMDVFPAASDRAQVFRRVLARVVPTRRPLRRAPGDTTHIDSGDVVTKQNRPSSSRRKPRPLPRG